MRDSINNFIDLLVKGDSFLIFLVIMLVIIIGVIVCLVRLQIGDKEYYEDDEDESADIQDKIMTAGEIDTIKSNTNKEEKKPEFARFVAPEEEEITPKVTLKDKMREYEKKEESLEEVKEDNTQRFSTYDDIEEDEVVSNNTYEAPNKRVIEQSRFDFDADSLKETDVFKESEENSEYIKNYDYEETSDKVDDLVRGSFDIENSISMMSNEEDRDLESEVSYNNLQSPLEFNGYTKEDIKEYSPQYTQNTQTEEITRNEISDYEREQEEQAIISARELESRINTMKETGEYEQHQEELRKYEQELENKAIISYDELLRRASDGTISYESEENVGGISIGKVDTNKIEMAREGNDKPYYKEEAFLEAMKEFRRAL